VSIHGFNLLKQQKAPPTSWEKIYVWALGTARIIVIIVELIVVGAFVSRVVVDTQGKRLDKNLETRQATLSAFKETETGYRIIQAKATNYKVVWENASNYAAALQELDNLLSANYANLRISIDKDFVTIRGEGDINQIENFETKFKESKYFSNVETFEVDSSSGDSDRRGSFGIRGYINDYNKRKFE